jgi:hypothetical protein
VIVDCLWRELIEERIQELDELSGVVGRIPLQVQRRKLNQKYP